MRHRTSDLDRIVVVGGGRAAVAAVEELERLGFTGAVTVLAGEPHSPYHRPACSKGLLTGQRHGDVRLSTAAPARWLTGRVAAELDAKRQIVYAQTGEMYEYDALVVATGASPVVPGGWPVGEPGLHFLHGIDDALGLAADLRRARRVAVVGAGLTGCEAAHVVRSMARECVMIDSNAQVMTRAVGSVTGGLIADTMRHEGVRMRLGRRVKHLSRSRRGWRLDLDDGSHVDADVVIATLGERPDTGWFTARHADTGDGLLCDESLRVQGVDRVVAAGAVARWPNAWYAEQPGRVDQWIAAMELGQAAARTLLSGSRAAPAAAVLPRYWSDLFGLRIQVIGRLDQAEEVAVSELRPGRRDIARGGVLAAHRRGGVTTGVVAVNAPRQFTTLARAMREAGAAARPVVSLPAVVPNQRRLSLVG
ncbi:NAD(P)/FAD-dependent oxidoreductase [Catellatospora methionotrophica]|uniref:NAD(P)/FAD-dependent oxidoreductase n=1 Tax=Catellatospora methionotrophica TaxID=121620 RepID=UPI0033E741F1